jgi:hypothetical protein
MISVAINPDQFSASGLTYTPGANAATFTFPAAVGQKPVIVSVEVNGANLQFFPERSSLHRRVLATLGVALP